MAYTITVPARTIKLSVAYPGTTFNAFKNGYVNTIVHNLSSQRVSVKTNGNPYKIIVYSSSTNPSYSTAIANPSVYLTNDAICKRLWQILYSNFHISTNTWDGTTYSSTLNPTVESIKFDTTSY